MHNQVSVSYTHLDVYKRQPFNYPLFHNCSAIIIYSIFIYDNNLLFIIQLFGDA